MSVYNEVKLAVEQELAELDQLLSALNNEILATFKEGIIWSVPAPKWVDHSSLQVERHVINPELKQGMEAAAFASSYFAQLHFEQDQSPIYASRAPGVISVGSSAIDLVDKINIKKQAIREIVTSRVEVGSRRRFVRDILNQPGLNLSYVYRTIKVLPLTTTVVRFSWENKQFKHLKLTPEQVRLLCDRAKVLNVNEAWDYEVQRVKDAAGSGRPIVKRMPQPPKPRARYKMVKDGVAEWGSFDASTPLITSSPLPDIEPLLTWTEEAANDVESGKARRERADKGVYELLSKALNLFFVSKQIQ